MSHKKDGLKHSIHLPIRAPKGILVGISMRPDFAELAADVLCVSLSLISGLIHTDTVSTFGLYMSLLLFISSMVVLYDSFYCFYY